MSFILDALKKSENERQRQIGPSLADVQTTRRRQDKPWWVVAVAALLVVNLGVLLIVLIRDGDAQPSSNATAVQVQPQVATQVPQQSAPQNAGQTSQNGSGAVVASSPAVRSLADEASSDPLLTFDPVTAGPLAAAQVPEGPPMVRSIEPPSVAPLPNPAAFQSHEAPNSNEVLPTLMDLQASGRSIPDMHLDIHVNAAKASDRFIFVNMRKYVEGQTLNEGPTVERINADGVILNQQGLRFLLPRQ
jgi:general secretion pathway protein B